MFESRYLSLRTHDPKIGIIPTGVSPSAVLNNNVNFTLNLHIGIDIAKLQSKFERNERTGRYLCSGSI